MGEVSSAFSSVPLYAQVAEDIRRRILSGELRAGDRIPPELELCELYRVSRVTVRRGIDELVRERLLTRRRAKGTFVRRWRADERDGNYPLLRSFTEEMREQGRRAVTLWASASVEGADARVAQMLHVSQGSRHLVLRRTRGAGERPFVYFETHLTYRDDYPEDDGAYYGSLYQLLRERGVTLELESECIEAIRAPRVVQEALGIGRSAPVLKRTRCMRAVGGGLREFTECYYLGSEYKYLLTFP